MRGGDAGGRGDGHAGALGAGVADELVKYVRLARTGRTGEEHVRARIQDCHRLGLQHAVLLTGIVRGSPTLPSTIPHGNYSPSGLPFRS